MTKFYGAAHGLIRKDGRYLVTRRSRINDYMPLVWDIPGGTIDPGETAEQGLYREISEETGIVVSVKEPIFVYTNLGGYPGRQTFQMIFNCDYVSGDIRLNPDEHDEFQWLELAEIDGLKKIAFFEELMKTVEFLHAKETKAF